MESEQFNMTDGSEGRKLRWGCHICLVPGVYPMHLMTEGRKVSRLLRGRERMTRHWSSTTLWLDTCHASPRTLASLRKPPYEFGWGQDVDRHWKRSHGRLRKHDCRVKRMKGWTKPTEWSRMELFRRPLWFRAMVVPLIHFCCCDTVPRNTATWRRKHLFGLTRFSPPWKGSHGCRPLEMRPVTAGHRGKWMGAM